MIEIVKYEESDDVTINIPLMDFSKINKNGRRYDLDSVSNLQNLPIEIIHKEVNNDTREN